jgi:hypothetical protein
MLSAQRAVLRPSGYVITMLYAHRRIAMRIAASAAELASKEAVGIDAVELLALELDELRGCVEAGEPKAPSIEATTSAA